ncbi:MAG: sulfite exporter TauE/SafE family protein [Candidatus Aenigmarchaeota archaeon]|nr:sulfite exporter TauE/SafE family protein [Candidatus Aenigmarchaeota archaeon]
MIFEIALMTGLSIALMAFFAEYADSSLGMGYGTSLTPILLLMGFEPLQVVPSVLVSELVTGILAGIMHHKAGNVSFGREKGKISRDTTIMAVIAACSIVGTVAAVVMAVSLPPIYVKLYIGILMTSMGAFILITSRKIFPFSWTKITAIGMTASFNKGISGGGYGPLVTGGQMISGVKSRNAVGITSLAEGLTCAVGIAAYIAWAALVDWTLVPYLTAGAVLSVPLSAKTVKKINHGTLRVLIGVATLILGAFTIVKIFM